MNAMDTLNAARRAWERTNDQLFLDLEGTTMPQAAPDVNPSREARVPSSTTNNERQLRSPRPGSAELPVRRHSK